METPSKHSEDLDLTINTQHETIRDRIDLNAEELPVISISALPVDHSEKLQEVRSSLGIEKRNDAENLSADIERLNEAANIRDAFYAMSASIEKAPEKSKKISGLMKYAQIGMAVLGLTYGSQDAFSKENPEKFKLASLASNEYSDEAARTAYIEKTGVDFSLLAHEIGSKSKMLVDNGNGRYVVHIGQSHYLEGLQWTKHADTVEASQRRVESLLLHLNQMDPSTTNIFHEGICDNQISDFCEDVRTKIEDSLRAGNYKAVETLHEDMEPKLSKAWARTLVAYLFKTRIDSLAPNAPELISLSTRLSQTLGEDLKNLYIGSASDKMLVEGKVRMLPAERERTMDEKEKLDSKLKSHKHEISVTHQLIADRSKELQKLTEQHAAKKIIRKEAQKLGGEIAGLKVKALELQKQFDEVLMPEYEEMIFTGREDDALEKIDELADSTQKIIPLVYGRAHDFSDNIKKYNLEHPDHKIGLIQIDTAGSGE